MELRLIPEWRRSITRIRKSVRKRNGLMGNRNGIRGKRKGSHTRKATINKEEEIRKREQKNLNTK